jgi:GTP-binding protein HflX
MYKAILVGANINNDPMMEYYMDELKNLALASNVEVLYSMTQSVKSITPKFYIGSGKVEEIKTFIENLEADVVIFNNELSGSQIRNLEEALGVRVVDRTLLIIDIFIKRAKTKEAMLQVEIAQLNYLKTRLVGMRTSLNRQQGGIGSRGPGEKKLELDRRRIDHEIVKLNKELVDIVKSRKMQRKNRNKSNIKKIAIVGYTNAGKSTLLNALLEFTNKDQDKQVFVENMLFATLETATRVIHLDNNKQFILTDTVGFISNLPHSLVESFKSTLEEITEADYLIHVVDTSNIYHEDQIEVTNKTLEEIGVHDIETLYVYNKFDLLDRTIEPRHYPNAVVSLLTENGVDKVLTLIKENLFKEYEDVTLLIPYSEGELVSLLNENYNIISQEYENEGTKIIVELNQEQKMKYESYIIE